LETLQIGKNQTHVCIELTTKKRTPNVASLMMYIKFIEMFNWLFKEHVGF